MEEAVGPAHKIDAARHCTLFQATLQERKEKFDPDVQGKYDWIVSNPPFHKDIKTDYQVTLNFIEQSAGFLNKGGRLRIVANRFLKYQPVMERHIGTCRTVAANRQYCVYEAIRN